MHVKKGYTERGNRGKGAGFKWIMWGGGAFFKQFGCKTNQPGLKILFKKVLIQLCSMFILLQ